MSLVCSLCQKRLSRKTARMINGKVMCSACLFPPTQPVRRITIQLSGRTDEEIKADVDAMFDGSRHGVEWSDSERKDG